MKLQTVMKNTAWMGLVQVANMALPLVTVPLVSRAFGPALYGLVASLTAISGYAGLLVIFGFHLSGPRAVARLDNDPSRISAAFSSIYFGQAILATLSAVAILSALPLLGFRNQQWVLGAIILFGVIASSLTPIWMFVGLQRMRQVAITQLVTRGLGTALILAFVRTPDDVVLLAVVNSAASLVCLAWSLLELRRLGYRLGRVTRAAPLEAIRSAGRIFVSSAAINLYTASNVVVVTFLAGPAAAGYFALADRIRGAAVGVLDPVSQALYPYLCVQAANEVADSLRLRNRRLFFMTMIAISVMTSLCLYFIAPVFAGVLGGEKFAAAIPILKVLSAAPILICVNNLIGLQVMLPLDMEAELSRIVICAAGFGLPLLIGATYLAGAIGTAFAYVAVELCITVAEVCLVNKREPIVGLFLPVEWLRMRQA